ncbi:selenoprotein M-like [Tribolium madens]|uniref:selenoprotein M-like n=1 Tax=Tribolium madens TaxID=41895 RepID=UPI001CF740F1|nr:selenoprotein M-like [Tribolium madens]
MKICASLLISCIAFLALANAEAANTKIARARVESCPSCKLNRLPEVKAFIYEDLPKYDNTEFKKIQGAPPVLLFLNDADEIVEQHSLEKFSRQECNNLLKSKGFNIKDKEL